MCRSLLSWHAPVTLKAIDVFPSSGRWIEEDHVLPLVSMHLCRWRYILLKQQTPKARSGVNLQERKGLQRVPLGSTWQRARNFGSPKNIKQRIHVWRGSVYYCIPIFYFFYKHDCTITKNNDHTAEYNYDVGDTHDKKAQKVNLRVKKAQAKF